MTRGPTTALLCLAALVVGTAGHGRLMNPPARNAMWRYGYPNPVNYNDNELYCGGYVVQYQKNGGKCGVCGDNYVEKVPRSHENGGLFGNGIITKNYVAGQVIEIEVDLTTNHQGYMELKLCPHNDRNTIITQECLDQYPLKVVGQDDSKFFIPKGTPKSATLKWKAQLPEGVTCSACVVQWKYFAGNTWGVDNTTGEGAQGLGPQETFINCADIYIRSNTQIGAPVDDNPWALYFRGAYPGLTHTEDVEPDKNGLKPLVVRAQLCLPTRSFEVVNGSYQWCIRNCLKYPPNCEETLCYCVKDCRAIGKLAEKKDADIFCHQNCLGVPSYCPRDMCVCS
ncbi:uncharacterized protein [Procambarus clarkii]|uniref:uncharacterized protein n=1 Tax=Procambarus clarkii TaxID=6728 RepID=UPI001E6718D9|nr:uncharacterized protein LOC123746819 [Procambarus clarkii]XP_045584552.1 uncharacterized protein LOC123746819 [Procambarus clarkii]